MYQAGNMAETASRVVQVIADTEPPSILLNVESEDTVSFGSVYQDPGVTAFDKVSQHSTFFCNSSPIQASSMQPRHSSLSFPHQALLGPCGPIDTCSFDIINLDSEVLVEAVALFPNQTIEELDTEVLELPITFPLDTDINIIYTVADLANNTDIAVRKVTVVDGSPPVITLVGFAEAEFNLVQQGLTFPVWPSSLIELSTSFIDFA